jgi:hypothetical protein
MSAMCSGRRPSYVSSTTLTLEPATGDRQRLMSENHHDDGHRIRVQLPFGTFHHVFPKPLLEPQDWCDNGVWHAPLRTALP